VVIIPLDLVPNIIGSGIGFCRDGCGIKGFIRRRRGRIVAESVLHLAAGSFTRGHKFLRGASISQVVGCWRSRHSGSRHLRPDRVESNVRGQSDLSLVSVLCSGAVGRGVPAVEGVFGSGEPVSAQCGFGAFEDVLGFHCARSVVAVLIEGDRYRLTKGDLVVLQVQAVARHAALEVLRRIAASRFAEAAGKNMVLQCNRITAYIDGLIAG